jgi:hypothetical protein
MHYLLLDQYKKKTILFNLNSFFFFLIVISFNLMKIIRILYSLTIYINRFFIEIVFFETKATKNKIDKQPIKKMFTKK